jgi:hypothetical protein
MNNINFTPAALAEFAQRDDLAQYGLQLTVHSDYAVLSKTGEMDHPAAVQIFYTLYCYISHQVASAEIFVHTSAASALADAVESALTA